MSTASIRAAQRLYARVARFRRLNDQAKSMVTPFVGTHVPLRAPAAWSSLQGRPACPHRPRFVPLVQPQIAQAKPFAVAAQRFAKLTRTASPA